MTNKILTQFLLFLSRLQIKDIFILIAKQFADCPGNKKGSQEKSVCKILVLFPIKGFSAPYIEQACAEWEPQVKRTLTDNEPANP